MIPMIPAINPVIQVILFGAEEFFAQMVLNYITKLICCGIAKIFLYPYRHLIQFAIMIT
jgi:hypothetical protein